MPLMAALSIGKMALPFLGSLFGGGAPTFDDLTKNTKDTSQMITGALRQAQDLRGDQITKSRELQSMDMDNQRSIGAFDPSQLGANFQADPSNPWAHLSGSADQFAGADFGAKGLRDSFAREMDITALAQQMGALAPSMNLGIDNLLMQGGQAAGAGMGTAIGAAGGGIMDAIGGLLGKGGGGGGSPMLGQPSFQDSGPVAEFGMPRMPSAAPPLPPSFGVGPAGAGGGGFLPPGSSAGGFDMSPMIQAIIQKATGER